MKEKYKFGIYIKRLWWMNYEDIKIMSALLLGLADLSLVGVGTIRSKFGEVRLQVKNYELL